MSRRGLFVTGTDTGVGKTLVGCAILRGLRERGLNVGAMKPVETGVGPAGPADAQALAEAAGADDPLSDVCPGRFEMPAAPSVAARHEGRVIDMEEIDASFVRQESRHDWLLVEGAGGLLVPILEDLDMADLAKRWQLPVLVVTRAALGTINHTRLTLAVARHRGLEVAGIIVNHGVEPISDSDRANLEELLRDPGAPILGEIPPLARGSSAAPHLRLDSIAPIQTA